MHTIILLFRSTLFPGQVIIPIKVSKNAQEHNVQLSGQVVLRPIKVKVHAVEMAFAITVHKIQVNKLFLFQIIFGFYFQNYLGSDQGSHHY